MHHLTWFQIYTKKERDKLNTGTGNRNNVLPPVAIKLIMLYDHNSFVKDVKDLLLILCKLKYQYKTACGLMLLGVETDTNLVAARTRLEAWDYSYDVKTIQEYQDHYQTGIRYLATTPRRTDTGDTALLYAMSKKEYSTVKAILNQGGVDLNYENAQGYTAFTFALWRGELEMLKALLAYQGPGAVTTDTIRDAQLWRLSGFNWDDSIDLKLLYLVIDDDRFLKEGVTFIAEHIALSLQNSKPEFVLALCLKLKQLPSSEPFNICSYRADKCSQNTMDTLMQIMIPEYKLNSEKNFQIYRQVFKLLVDFTGVDKAEWGDIPIVQSLKESRDALLSRKLKSCGPQFVEYSARKAALYSILIEDITKEEIESKNTTRNNVNCN